MTRPARKTWNPNARWQPPREGPLWETFLEWFATADIELKRRSVAWKAFHAAWMIYGK